MPHLYIVDFRSNSESFWIPPTRLICVFSCVHQGEYPTCFMLTHYPYPIGRPPGSLCLFRRLPLWRAVDRCRQPRLQEEGWRGQPLLHNPLQCQSNVKTFTLSNIKTFTISGRPLLPNLHDLPLSLCFWMAPGCRDPLQSLWGGRWRLWAQRASQPTLQGIL